MLSLRTLGPGKPLAFGGSPSLSAHLCGHRFLPPHRLTTQPTACHKITVPTGPLRLRHPVARRARTGKVFFHAVRRGSVQMPSSCSLPFLSKILPECAALAGSVQSSIDTVKSKCYRFYVEHFEPSSFVILFASSNKRGVLLQLTMASVLLTASPW